ncbi:MAG TPA: polyphosphate polymerase domain-containing protein [Bacteroidales bacterium]|nr:polyphosphate polymerase domain-containing protein [Bacteroidales bacterium]
MEDNLFDTVTDLVREFKPVSLSEMDQVKLMDRIDSKFVLPFCTLPAILQCLSSGYYVLTIKEMKAFNYQTDYFDTPGLNMYFDHHNGRPNRYKVRQREYVESAIKFIEVKFKNNKGRVKKERIQIHTNDQDFGSFVKNATPYHPDDLSIILTNRFNRFTLVDYNFSERVTVDFNLVFNDNTNKVRLTDLVIIEVKQSKASRQSLIFKALRQYGLHPESFSKYCLGVSLLNRTPKINNFKHTVNLINKLSHVELSA